MQFDVVNSENKKVGSVDVSDDVFGGRVNADLIWESVVRANAADRRGTHMTKNRALVSGSGKKPWRQKGTGRARVGEIRNPLWRHGGTVFGPQPRSYDYALPKKVERGALRAALAQKMKDGALVVVDTLSAGEVKTKAAAEMLKRLGIDGKAVLIDTAVDEKLAKSLRNIEGVEFVASARVNARSVMTASKIVATRGAIEKLQEVLARSSPTSFAGRSSPRKRRFCARTDARSCSRWRPAPPKPRSSARLKPCSARKWIPSARASRTARKSVRAVSPAAAATGRRRT